MNEDQPSPQEEMRQFVLDRDEALLSLDKEKILAYYAKYNPHIDVNKMRQAHQLAFWGGVHKAITGATSLPIEFRRQSKEWLQRRGMSSFDDGDL